MRIVNFQKYDEPYALPNHKGSYEVASFDIEIEIEGKTWIIILRGWSVREMEGKHYLQGPLVKCFSRKMKGPAVLVQSPTPNEFVLKVTSLLSDFGYNISRRAFEARPKQDKPKTVPELLASSKKILADLEAAKGKILKKHEQRSVKPSR